MDGIINDFPQPFTEYACPRRNQTNFHVKTRNACKEGHAGNISLKVSKSIVVGDLSVGKTSLINRYCHNVFEKDYKPTIGVEYELRKYKVLDQEFHLQMWDTSGEERFKCITAAYYRGSNVIVVVFDLYDTKSFHNASKWLEDALEKTVHTTPELFLVGNKLDLMKSGELEEVRENAIDLANQLNAEYWEVSAKSGKNVKEFFERVAALCFDQAVLRETSHAKEGKIQMGTMGNIHKKEQKTDIIVLGTDPKKNSASSEREKNKCC